MEHERIYDVLLDQARRVYQSHPATSGFAPFPQDVARQLVEPFHCDCADIFRQETELVSDKYPALQAAIHAAGPIAQWRETYKETEIGDDFMRRFGCYCIIGEGGPFWSETLWAWMVYMPTGLYYPWHNHPAEEMYLVVSGSAVFRREGCADEALGAGDTWMHTSNQRHAMETTDKPVLCLVFWRNGFEIAPVLSNADCS